MSQSAVPSLQSLKEEAEKFRDEAAELAAKRLVRPARRLAREAREALGEGAEKTEETLVLQRERAAAWIAAHPFAAVGIALGAGFVLSRLLDDRS
jgi:ElaB/YqjD/DUF883 family membrane-anchored ribosome-binding protein